MYQKTSHSVLKHWDFILGDLIALVLSLWISYAVKNNTWNLWADELYTRVALGIVVVHLVLAVAHRRSYKSIVYRGDLREVGGVLEHVSLVMALILALAFLLKITGNASRQILLVFYATAIVLIYGYRLLWKRHLRAVLQRENLRQIFLVGSDAALESMLRQFHKHGIYGFNICAACGLGEGGETVREVPVVARNTEDALRWIETHVVDEVIFVDDPDMPLPSDMLDECELMGLTVHIVVGYIDILDGETSVERIAGVPVVTSAIHMVSPWELAVKRCVDILGSLVGLLILGVAFIFVAPAIYFSDPGPIFFTQLRVGKNGRVFKLFKFRSMYQDAEARKKEFMDKNEMSGFMFKMENDPRIIGSGPDGKRHGIGWLIRTFSIDELPQFWNIFKGDMSLVGTRPPTLDEWVQYEAKHRTRMRVHPGLTGMWQVSGRSDLTDFEEVVRLDTQYIQNWSFALDIKILFKTVMIVLTRQGSK